jgi:hypothetical protein
MGSLNFKIDRDLGVLTYVTFKAKFKEVLNM